MRIVRAQYRSFALPLAQPMRAAFGVVDLRRGGMLRLEDEGGTAGCGEIVVHPARAGNEAPAALLEQACRMLEGTCLDRLEQTEDGNLPDELCPAVEMAVLDLLARRRGVSAAELLGTVRRTRVPLNAVVEAAAGAAAVREARREGFRCLKVKLPRCDPGAAAEVVGAICRAAAGDPAVRVDAGGQWGVREAVEFLRRLPEPGVEYVEDPVPAIEGMALVRGLTGARIAADAAIRGPDDVELVAEREAADVVVLKPSLTGLLRARRAAARARERGLEVVITSSFDSSLGIAAAAHLAAVLPDPLSACGLATARLFADEPVRPRLLPKGGFLELPRGPGLGVAWSDRAALRPRRK